MPNFSESPFKLTKGVDNYNPDVTDVDLQFVRLKNVQPKFGRWVTPDGLKIKETIQAGIVVSVKFDSSEPDFFASLTAGGHINIYGVKSDLSAKFLGQILEADYNTTKDISAMIEADSDAANFIGIGFTEYAVSMGVDERNFQVQLEVGTGDAAEHEFPGFTGHDGLISFLEGISFTSLTTSTFTAKGHQFIPAG